MTEVSIALYGSKTPLPPRKVLRAGPLVVTYEAGELRYLKLGGQEILRRWYVAVRDHNWATIQGTLSDEKLDIHDNHFQISYSMGYKSGPIRFRWRAEISGQVDGTIRFSMRGIAESTFYRNRIGFCILHPVKPCAGKPCSIRDANGAWHDDRFPKWIAPQNPFFDLSGIAYEIGNGCKAELTFEGDLFETEDQRNWTDASFKTFCTPLRIPFPVKIAAGTEIVQSVTLRVVDNRKGEPLESNRTADKAGNAKSNHAAPSDLVYVSLANKPNHGTLPKVGLSVASEHKSLSPRQQDLLKRLGPTHLRIECDVREGDNSSRILSDLKLCAALGTSVELAVTADLQDRDLVEKFAQWIAKTKLPLARWIAYDRSNWAMSPTLANMVRSIILASLPGVPVYAGTQANFAELNRTRPPTELLDGICFSAQPQEHAFDNASLVETCAALADVMDSTRQFADGLPIAVTPITMRKRVNPYLTRPSESGDQLEDGRVEPAPVSRSVKKRMHENSAESTECAASEMTSLPDCVDPRQMSLFGGVWTLGTLKYLCEAGVSSLTFFETVGWLGVMETDFGRPFPEGFPSQKAMVFPLYHVLADIGELQGECVIASQSSDPLRVESLVVRKQGIIHWMLANMTERIQVVELVGCHHSRQMRVLDEQSFDVATNHPQRFRESRNLSKAKSSGAQVITLLPFAYMHLVDEMESAIGDA